MTKKEIKQVIESCKWRKDFYGVPVCTGDIVPCEKHIYDGRCDTLIKLYSEKSCENNNK